VSVERFAGAARMEWIKLRGLRSTWVTLAITLAGAVGIAVAVGHNTRNAAADLTNNALAGITVGLLAIGILGVMAMAGEYGTGTIRSTLAAVPSRWTLLAAKAAVCGAVALAVGEAGAFVAFLAGGAALPASIPAPGLGQPGVLRAVVLTGAGFALVGLLGLGLGAILRHTAAAIAVLVGGVWVAGQIAGAAVHQLLGWVPIAIVANSLGVARPVPEFLTPWAGLAVLGLYAAAALGAGGWLLAKRDA